MQYKVKTDLKRLKSVLREHLILFEGKSLRDKKNQLETVLRALKAYSRGDN